MSTSESRVREEFKDDGLFSFDPTVGYVRITEEKMAERLRRYDELLESGEITAKDRDFFAKELSEKNERNAEADRKIKMELGDSHFYGEIGTPLLLEDRYRFGLS